jgi:glycosyltransferase involved in cell wall biosynthesis
MPRREWPLLKTLIIIPAYNEEATIARVIRQIKFNIPEADILVVNDGSGDNTSRIALSSDVTVADLPFNLGIGGAVQTGYLYAREKNYDIAIQVDGDGQHNPAYIRKMMEPVINNRADMVIGSRYVNKTAYRSSIPRRIGMLFFSVLVKLLTGQKVNDTTSGFRVVNKSLINIFCRSYPSDYP